MSYTISEDFLKHEPSVIERLENPLDFLNMDQGCRTAARNSINETMARQEQEIQSLASFEQHEANPIGLKRQIFSSVTHDIFNEPEDKILDFEPKCELSEENMHVEDRQKEFVEVGSFLRGSTTFTGLSRSIQSAEEFDSHFEIPNSNEMSFAEPITENYEEPTLEKSSDSKISRAGLRKMRPHYSAYANKNSSYRQRKSDDQVKILTDLYQKHKGKLNRKVRKEAMAQTGLAWIQIYKWFFDRQLKKSAIEKACCTQYPGQIFRVIGKDGREIGKPSPIFLVEKVRSRQTAGKLTVS